MSTPDKNRNIDSILDYLLSPSPTTAGSSYYDRFRQRHTVQKITLLMLGALLSLVLFSYMLWWKPPQKFPAGMLIAVTEGMTLSETSALLADLNVIKSPFWFKAWSVFFGGDKGLKAGEYYLAGPISVFELAKRFTRGIQNVVPVKVTVPEGLSNREIAALLSRSLPKLDTKRFIELGKEKEGYLFPDTYVFLPGVKEEQIIAEMEANFIKRIEPLQEDIAAFQPAQEGGPASPSASDRLSRDGSLGGKPLHDILTMAALIEEEARTSETRKHISGILWNRLELGMPLQVDAVFPYIIGKNTYEVTLDDLRYDSPYNTYLYAGLPPGPISNPGLDSIMAAIDPTPTKYLYYLTDNDGQMRYATTHAQHLTNRAKYLGK